MKKIIFLLINIIIPSIAFPQLMDINNKDLSPVILNKQLLISFIENDFHPFSISRQNLVQQNHPLEIYMLNRIPKSDPLRYNLMGIPITEIYGYVKDKDHVSLYMLMTIDSAQLDSFVKELGIPQNVSFEDYIKRDFEVAMWERNGIWIDILSNFSTTKATDKKIVIIHNIEHIDLINLEPL